MFAKFNLSKFCLALALSQVLFIVYGALYWSLTHRLPPPFFYDVYDTFMDFYHTNFWAKMSGRYQDWHSIYPIFTFWLGQHFSSAQCIDVADAFSLRVCSPESIWLLLGAYVIGSVIAAWLAVRNLPLSTFGCGWRVLVIGFTVLMTSPSLFAIERGNYILLAFTFIALSEWMGRNWRGALFLALAINLKQYLVVLWLVPLLKRRYDYLIMSILFALVINQLAMIVVADGHYGMLFENMFGFANISTSAFFEKMWYATSFSSWASVIGVDSKIEQYFSPGTFRMLRFVLDSCRWLSLGLALASVLVAILNSRYFNWEEVSLIILVALMVMVGSVGGYAAVLLTPFMMRPLHQGKLTHLLPLLFLFATPLDIPLGPSRTWVQISYLTGQPIEQLATVTLGMYLRPVLLVLLLVGLIYPVLKQRSNILGRDNFSIFPVNKKRIRSIE